MNIPEEQIISLAFAEMGVENFWPVEGEKFCNPFREDHNGDCYFEHYKGYLRLVDYGYREFHNMNCFGMLMRAKGFKHISECLNFLRRLGKTEYTKVQRQPYEMYIEWETRDPIPQDWEYWQKFGTSVFDLQEDGVHFIKRYRHNTKKNPFLYYDKTFTFCYGYQFDTRIKIYSPFQEIRFITNCLTSDIGYMDKPKKTDTLFVTKSYKDARIILNHGFDVRWIQSEGSRLERHCPDIVKEWIKRWKQVVFLYDLDNSGFHNSITMAKEFNCYAAAFPDFFYNKNLKDPGEIYSRYLTKGFMWAMENLQIIHKPI